MQLHFNDKNNTDLRNEFSELRTLAGRTFLYSGRPNEEDPHLEAVGMLMSKRAKCTVCSPAERPSKLGK
jgi:hypothetical protein